MKGFKDSTRMRSGFKFPDKAGFTSSSGSVQTVRGYTRRVPKARGGYVSGPTTVGDQGHSAVQRSRPVTEFDKQHGGKGPLAAGFAKGGRAPKRSVVKAEIRKAMAEHVRKARPVGHGVGSFNSKPLIGD
jgi:hypothetical protein